MPPESVGHQQLIADRDGGGDVPQQLIADWGVVPQRPMATSLNAPTFSGGAPAITPPHAPATNGQSLGGEHSPPCFSYAFPIEAINSGVYCFVLNAHVDIPSLKYNCKKQPTMSGLSVQSSSITRFCDKLNVNKLLLLQPENKKEGLGLLSRERITFKWSGFLIYFVHSFCFLCSGCMQA